MAASSRPSGRQCVTGRRAASRTMIQRFEGKKTPRVALISRFLGVLWAPPVHRSDHLMALPLLFWCTFPTAAACPHNGAHVAPEALEIRALYCVIKLNHLWIREIIWAKQSLRHGRCGASSVSMIVHVLVGHLSVTLWCYVNQCTVTLNSSN